MSTARFRTALAWSCISLVAGAAVGVGPQPVPASLELEIGLARTREVYLLVDAGREVVEVKARGVVLERLPLRRSAVLAPGPLLGGGVAPGAELPAVWRVVEPPGDLDRRVVAPETLEPYSEEVAQSEPEGSTPTPTPSDAPRHPRYGLLVDAGWRVEVGQGVAHLGLVERLADGLAHLWLRLTGGQVERPPVLALDLEPAHADRLHHLFRTGLAILVVPPVAGSSAEAGATSPRDP